MFTQFGSSLDWLAVYCEYKKFKFSRIDGKTSFKERNNLIRGFNSPGSGTFIFLISTRAGGTGINLTGASKVIFLELDWNPQVDRQAIDRVHRIGQQKIFSSVSFRH